MKKLLFFVLFSLLSLKAFAEPTSCAGEASLSGRSDILHCEPWSSATWWENGYLETGRKNVSEPATSADQTSVQTNCFAGGPCLRVNCYAYNAGGCGGMLAHHWPIPGTQQEVYLRYYIRMSSNWDTTNYDSSGVAVDNGGKWPGLADVRTSGDTSGQCGNGGAYSDGINCWSGRLKYRNCTGSGGSDICTAGGGGETTRLGWYWYLPPATSPTNQEFGPFDNQSWGTTNATCSSSEANLGSTGTDNTSCGKGAAGLKNNTWYRVELRIKMNTAGVADGIAEAWISEVSSDGLTDVSTLKYTKTNVKFRESGHDDLHVRTVWLDVHMGGEGVGPLTDSYIELARLVVATKRIGGFRSSGSFVSQPFTVNVN